MIDPNPLVAGRGRADLESSGIIVSLGQQYEQARELNEAYIKHISTGMPFITVKFAMSLDGKIATHTGDSKWISSEESRQFAHNLRYTNDAIMCGVNTVLADDPQLTTRCCGGRGGTTKRQPLRIVVDGRGRTPTSARIFHESGETLLAFGRPPSPQEREDFARLNADVMEFPSESGVINLKELLRWLGQRQITSILVEGGGIMIGSLFDQGLVDKAVVFIAPIIIGGPSMSPVAGRGIERLADAYSLESLAVSRCGPDILVQGYVNPAR
jgi:diaminohydroxyphosphoribosylaminopyrimidine deaminase/5-amino-6-(5-phosphoribosylamino)uracil reductase